MTQIAGAVDVQSRGLDYDIQLTHFFQSCIKPLDSKITFNNLPQLKNTSKNV